MEKFTNKTKNFSLRKIIVLLIPLFVIPFITIFILKLPDYYILSKRGIETQGTVTNFNSESGQTWYQYSYNGKTFQDSFTYKGSKPNDIEWKVIFDPEKPQRNCLGNATEQLYNAAKMTIFLTVCIIIVSLFRIIFAFTPKTFEESDREFKEKWEDHKKKSLNK